MSGAAHGRRSSRPVETPLHRAPAECKVLGDDRCSSSRSRWCPRGHVVWPYAVDAALLAGRRGRRAAYAAVAAGRPAGDRGPVRALRARAAVPSARATGCGWRSASSPRRRSPCWRPACWPGRRRRRRSSRGAERLRVPRDADRDRRLRAALPAGRRSTSCGRMRLARVAARRRPALAVAGARRGAQRRRAGRAHVRARRARARRDARARLRRADAGARARARGARRWRGPAPRCCRRWPSPCSRAADASPVSVAIATRPRCWSSATARRDADGLEEFWALAEHVREAAGELPVGFGFIELAEPLVDAGIDELVARGATRRRLGAARAARRRAPQERRARRARRGPALRHPERARSAMGRDLGIDPVVLAVAEDRARAALGDVDPAESAVVLVGRGSSDPDASSRPLQGRAPARRRARARAWSSRRSRASPQPSVAGGAGALPAARRDARSSVVPFFLFTGVLVPRIYAQAAEWAAAHPGADVVGGRAPRARTGGSRGWCSSATARR